MFFDFGLKDMIDILLVAVILYYVYKLMKESRSLNVFMGIMMFVVVWLFVSQILEMRLLGSIMDKLVSVGVIALIVLFQEDIRKFLYNIGAHQHAARLLKLFASDRDKNYQADKEAIMSVVLACMSMSKRKEGALIVIERETSLSEVAETGDKIDANLNQRLIENIFFKNSPLHDGAMLISNKRIWAAGASCLSATILIFRRNWDCATGLLWAFPSRVMPSPLSFRKRLEEYPWPSVATSN